MLKSLTILFSDITCSKTVKAKVSPTIVVAKIVPNIITKMNLPVTAPDGTPMSYGLDVKELGIRLREDMTLPEQGVKEGMHVCVFPEVVAGAEHLSDDQIKKLYILLDPQAVGDELWWNACIDSTRECVESETLEEATKILERDGWGEPKEAAKKLRLLASGGSIEAECPTCKTKLVKRLL